MIEGDTHSLVYILQILGCMNGRFDLHIIWYAFCSFPAVLWNFDARNADADVAAAGDTCRDCRIDEEVHNSDADERAGCGRGECHPRGLLQRRRRTQRRRRRALAAAGAAARTIALPPRTWPWPAQAAQEAGLGGEDGRTAPQDVAVACQRRAFGRAVLYACCKLANWNKGPETKLCMPQKWQNCMIMQAAVLSGGTWSVCWSNISGRSKIPVQSVHYYLFLHHYYIIVTSLLLSIRNYT